MNNNKRKNKKIIKSIIIKILLILITIFIIFIQIFERKKELLKIFNIKNINQKVEQKYSSKDLKIGDLVFYNSRPSGNYGLNDNTMNLTFEKGSASVPGIGINEKLVLNENNMYIAGCGTVWDIYEDGTVELLFNDFNLYCDEEMLEKISYVFTTNSISALWFEHNMHKLISLFGYGYGAKKDATNDFKYMVGSKISGAPDMSEGDKGIWSIGKNGIDPSGARGLTREDIEKKLGITEEHILKNVDNYDEKKYHEIIPVISENILQRNIKSSNQGYVDEKTGLAKNNNYKMKRENYYLYKNIPNNIYSNILFTKELTTLSTMICKVDYSGKYISWDVGIIFKMQIDMGNTYAGTVMIGREEKIELYPYRNINVPTAFIVYLEPDLTYSEIIKDNGEKCFEVEKIKKEDVNVKFNIKNYCKDYKNKLQISADKVNKSRIESEKLFYEAEFLENSEDKEIYNINMKKFSGFKRENKDNQSVFSNMENVNDLLIKLPDDYDFKIIGIDDKRIDLDKSLEYDIVVFPKSFKYTVNVKYEGGENDPNFKIKGNLKLISDNQVLKEQKVELKRDIKLVHFNNIDIFNYNTNQLKKIKLVFEKAYTDLSKHEVKITENNINVKYVPNNRNIEIKALFKNNDSKYLDEIELNLMNNDKIISNIILDKKNNFKTNISVLERDNLGNVINYKIRKKSLNEGFITKVDGFNVILTPILKLPLTGTNLLISNLMIISIICLILGISMRNKNKMKKILKDYNIIK